MNILIDRAKIPEIQLSLPGIRLLAENPRMQIGNGRVSGRVRVILICVHDDALMGGQKAKHCPPVQKEGEKSPSFCT